MIYTVNQSPFTGGEILTEASIRQNWGTWFGFPESLIDIFLNTRRVETANRYLKDIEITWRVSAINIVDGHTQWTVA
tara:strand:- start:558 stop:788 length:231 start_codon:yes stop_codon:yes gene_type:complete